MATLAELVKQIRETGRTPQGYNGRWEEERGYIEPAPIEGLHVNLTPRVNHKAFKRKLVGFLQKSPFYKMRYGSERIRPHGLNTYSRAVLAIYRCGRPIDELNLTILDENETDRRNPENQMRILDVDESIVVLEKALAEDGKRPRVNSLRISFVPQSPLEEILTRFPPRSVFSFEIGYLFGNKEDKEGKTRESLSFGPLQLGNYLDYPSLVFRFWEGEKSCRFNQGLVAPLCKELELLQCGLVHEGSPILDRIGKRPTSYSSALVKAPFVFAQSRGFIFYTFPTLSIGQDLGRLMGIEQRLDTSPVGGLIIHPSTLREIFSTDDLAHLPGVSSRSLFKPYEKRLGELSRRGKLKRTDRPIWEVIDAQQMLYDAARASSLIEAIDIYGAPRVANEYPKSRLERSYSLTVNLNHFRDMEFLAWLLRSSRIEAFLVEEGKEKIEVEKHYESSPRRIDLKTSLRGNSRLLPYQTDFIRALGVCLPLS